MTRFAPALLLFAACATPAPRAPLEAQAPPIEYYASPAEGSSAPTTTTAPPTTTPTTSAPARVNLSDAPEISRSIGDEGGVIVFWPRVIPRSESPEIQQLAFGLQQRLRAIVQRAVPGRAVDVRPSPERSCPRAGCNAATVGVLLAHTGGGSCVAVALVSAPGQSPQELVAWGGRVRLKSAQVPFREPPESQLAVEDSFPCSTLLADPELAAHEQAIAEALVRAAR